MGGGGVERVQENSVKFYLYDPWRISEAKEISSVEYDALHSACSFLSEYIRFEENIMAVKNAMYEYENFVLHVSLDHEFNPDSDHDYFQDKRVMANGKVLSVLNSITSFRDQFPTFKQSKKSPSAREIFDENWKLQKQANVHFEFCEVLRNFAQHNTQPVSGVTVGGGWDSQREWRESHTSIFVSVSEVSADRKVSAESKTKFLEHIGRKADVSLILREGIDCLGEVSKEMRSWLTSEFDQSSDTYDHYLKRGQYEGFIYFLLSTEVAGSIAGRQIFPAFLERAKRLRRNQVLTHTADHYISSRARGHTKE